MKTLIFVASVISFMFCPAANAEICIANHCTNANSVSAISVSSVNNSWNCSGPGCTAFQAIKIIPIVPTTPLVQSDQFRNRIIILKPGTTLRTKNVSIHP